MDPNLYMASRPYRPPLCALHRHLIFPLKVTLARGSRTASEWFLTYGLLYSSQLFRHQKWLTINHLMDNVSSCYNGGQHHTTRGRSLEKVGQAFSNLGDCIARHREARVHSKYTSKSWTLLSCAPSLPPGCSRPQRKGLETNDAPDSAR